MKYITIKNLIPIRISTVITAALLACLPVTQASSTVNLSSDHTLSLYSTKVDNYQHPGRLPEMGNGINNAYSFSGKTGRLAIGGIEVAGPDWSNFKGVIFGHEIYSAPGGHTCFSSTHKCKMFHLDTHDARRECVNNSGIPTPLSTYCWQIHIPPQINRIVVYARTVSAPCFIRFIDAPDNPIQIHPSGSRYMLQTLIEVTSDRRKINIDDCDTAKIKFIE